MAQAASAGQPPAKMAAPGAGGRAAATQPAAPSADGLRYPVSRFEIEYRFGHPKLPKTEELANVRVTLGETPDGFVAPRAGVALVTSTLAQLSGGGVRNYYASALHVIEQSLAQNLADRGLMGVFVEIDPAEIERGEKGEALRDLRRDRTALKLLVSTSKVGGIRSIASGERVPLEERVNAPAHERIRTQSPVAQGDLLSRAELDDFILRLNRHPGRRVDIAVAASETAGEVMLDYLVAENKPWFVYAQVSNTGTEATNEWRERFGFVHNQLTGHDDIFSIDYTTASFDGSSQAATAAYEAPFFSSQRLRWRVYGSWSDFTASDVGQIRASFTGTEWYGGGEMIANIYQKKTFFVDAFAGARYQNVEVDQMEGTGEGAFVLPYIGLRIEQFKETSSTSGELRLTWGIGDVDRQDLDLLGRLGTDDHWTVLSGDVTHSFFLEPLISPGAFRRGESTLAHEIFLAAKGQWAFDNRLIPQEEETLGGFFTVRGYDESILAADSAIIATAEYRYHLPRGLKPSERAWRLPWGDFRYAPARPYARPDWDLILRGFVDVGRAMYSERRDPERDETLVGAGVGVELQVRQNFNIRLDWGFALEDLEELDVEAGDSRLHVSMLLLF